MIIHAMAFADQRLSKVSRVTCSAPRSEVAVLNVDGNNLSTLMGVESYTALIQVSCLLHTFMCILHTFMSPLHLHGSSLLVTTAL